jgi:TonB family protein
MSGDVRFWRNLALIGLAHVALITGFLRLGRAPKNPGTQNIVWMNGAVGDGGSAATPAQVMPRPKPVSVSTPPPPSRSDDADEPGEEHPVVTTAKSEIQLPPPKPTPAATPRPAPTPKVKATPGPAPKSKPTPKPSPKSTPKKTLLVKASPKPAPKPTPREEVEEKADVDALRKEIAKAALQKTETASDETEKPKIAAVQAGSGKASSSGGRAGGAGGESPFGWYGSMLHDRFYSEWLQPAGVASSGAKNSVLVKIRIEKDGRVSSFEIVRPCGDAAVDESVAAVAKRMTQVDPLPAGLGSGEHYDVKIRFELNSE